MVVLEGKPGDEKRDQHEPTSQENQYPVGRPAFLCKGTGKKTGFCCRRGQFNAGSST